MNGIYQHKYNTSRAVIVGINEYKKLLKLGYAVNDANEIANCLIKKFGFERENLIKLLNRKYYKHILHLPKQQMKTIE